MKRTNKQKNSIILVFIITVFIFISSTFYLLYSITPLLIEINNDKKSVLEVQDKINQITNKGLSYNTFKELSSELDGKNNITNSSYLKKLLGKTDKDFYEKNFVNKGNISYLDFLKNKDIEINKELERSSKGIERDIKKILPNYSDSFLPYLDGGVLTDFKFINYLEELFNQFNLEYKGGLGIKNLENYYKGEDDLDTSIFYISLDFDLSGKKKDIIDFIHYFENVGYVRIFKNKLQIRKDSFISRDILFNGDQKENYNIYNHQLSDISYIKIPDYLDSSYIPRSTSESFTSFIKNDKSQNNEKIDIKIGLNFYTKGIENYIIKKQINIILSNFDGLLKSINSFLKDPNLVKSKNSKDILFLNSLKKKNKALQSIQKDILLIKRNINKKGENLNNLYKQAIKIDKEIDRSLILMGRIIYVKKNK